MRTSALFTVAFAAVALGSAIEKRDVVTVTATDVEYYTQVVTATAGQEAQATEAPAAPSATKAKNPHAGHRHRGKGKGKYTRTRQPQSVSQAPAPTSEAPAPEPTLSAYVPEPETTEAPAPETTEAPAPETTEAPAPEPTTEAPAPVYSSEEPAPPASSAAPAPPVYSQPASGAKATTYQDAVVRGHNFHRANHSSPDLQWDQGLADAAMEIAKTCVYEHSKIGGDGNYGQNIAAGVAAGQIGRIISDMFYNSEVGYFANNYGVANLPTGEGSNFEKWGHFSQIVWASTSKVGCATWDCSNSGTKPLLQKFAPGDAGKNPFFTVCNYASPGNFGGEYAENIGTCLNKPTVVGADYSDSDAITQSYQSLGGY